MRPPDSQYRPDVDGLRAVAVLAVLGYHVAPNRVTGGFVGVDVFFVISGFLISRIIVRAIEAGTFSYRTFYARRIRRIFPPLIVALLFTLTVAWWILLPDEFLQLGRHVAAGSLFASNVLLWLETGYFDRSAEQKPLLHLWSLGVEEQFYIIWPIALVLMWRLRRGHAAAIAAVAAASFVLNVALIARSPSATFYLPFARFWELLLGALLAVRSLRGDPLTTGFGLATWPPARLATLRHSLSFVGVGMIVASIALLDKADAFPGWFAVPPVVGSALIIAAGPEAWLNRRLLAHRVPVYIGLISYSLYLWHWPLLSFLHVLELDNTSLLRLLKIGAVAVAFSGAALTHHWVEVPLYRRASRVFPWRLVAGMCAVLLVGFVSIWTSGFATLRGPWTPGSEVSAGVADVREETFTQPCLSAYEPLFRPAFLARRDFCLLDGAPDGAAHGPRDVIVLGDSHAHRLYQGLRVGTGSTVLLGRGTCLPLLGFEARWPDEPGSLECAVASESLLQYVSRHPPRTLVLHGFFVRAVDGRLVRTSTVSVGDALAATLRLVAPVVPRVVIALDVPELPFSAATCLRRPVRPARPDCDFPRATNEATKAKYLPAFRAAAAGYANVVIFDPAVALCDERRCHGMLDGQLLYSDSHHVNARGARLIADSLRRHL